MEVNRVVPQGLRRVGSRFGYVTPIVSGGRGFGEGVSGVVPDPSLRFIGVLGVRNFDSSIRQGVADSHHPRGTGVLGQGLGGRVVVIICRSRKRNTVV